MINLFSKAAEYLWSQGKSDDVCDESSEDSEEEDESFDEIRPIYGKITDLFDDYGLIDEKFYFSANSAVGGYIPKIGDSVTGIASKNNIKQEWCVTQIHHSEAWDNCELDKESLATEVRESEEDYQDKKVEIGRVTSLNNGKIGLNDQEYCYQKNIECKFEIICGDWVTASFVGDENSDVWNLNEIHPLRQCHIEGEITSIGRTYGVVNNEVYFSLKVCKNMYYPKCGEHVHADVIESHQERYSWRAIKILPSITSSHVISLKKAHIKPSPLQSQFVSKLLIDKKGISISENLDFGVILKSWNKKYITAWIRNKSSDVHNLVKCKLQSGGESQFSIHSLGIMHENGKSINVDMTSSLVLYPMTSAFCNILCSPRNLGKEEQLLVCEFDDFSIGRYVHVDIQDDNQALLQASHPYVQRKNVKLQTFNQHQDSFIVPGEKLKRPKNFIPVHLPHFAVPIQLINLIDKKEDLLSVYPELMEDVTIDNYKRRMSFLLHLEEIQQRIDMQEFDMHRVCLRNVGEYLALTVPGLAEKRPSLMIGDRVFLTSPGNENSPAYEGYIHQVLSLEIFLKFNQAFHTQYNGEDYNVRFQYNRTPMRRCHQSVVVAVKLLRESVLFPTCLMPKIPQVIINEERKLIRTYSSVRNANCKENEWKRYIHKAEEKDDRNNSPPKNKSCKSNGTINYLSFPKKSKIAANFQTPVNIMRNKGTPSHEDPAKCSSKVYNPSTAMFIVPNILKKELSSVNKSSDHHNRTQKSAHLYHKTEQLNISDDSKSYKCPKVSDKSNGITIMWSNKELNSLQKAAVKRILTGSSRPVPYVLFGPPGTGKTITIVEAIVQTFLLVPSSRILTSTPSNSAADLIVERLHNTGLLQTNDLIRMNAFQRNLEGVSENVKRYCHENCDIEVAAHKRIIVCTCMSAGTFYNLGLKEGHFTHVFIDEAGQATEPESVTPVALAAGLDCQVVLSGDPLQLGPVIRSVPAKLYGLQVSLLERLMQCELYKRDSGKFKDHGNFNPLLVTKLVQNYRSHEAILKFSSEKFYDDELIPCADSNIVTKLCKWEMLKSQGFPIIFHGLVGDDAREGDSPSWFNPAEVFQCIYYLRKLFESDIDATEIGIITPYKKQVEKIRFMMTSLDIPMIKIGSVEEFQGQEKTVIILSTVRSANQLISFDVKHNLGFLSNPKRFNVAITRAQALLIVIGNPHVLMKDQYWGAFIDYCIRNNAYVGCSVSETHI